MSRDIDELERWIEEHPVQAHLNSVGVAILVCELAVGLRLLMEWVARCAQ